MDQEEDEFVAGTLIGPGSGALRTSHSVAGRKICCPWLWNKATHVTSLGKNCIRLLFGDAEISYKPPDLSMSSDIVIEIATRTGLRYWATLSKVRLTLRI